MKTMSFTEFRKNASQALNLVERGETIRLVRHGKSIAEIVPIGDRDRAPSWKRPGPDLLIRGASLSEAILDARRVST